MATFLGHPPPVLPPRTLNFSSSSSPPPQLPLQQPTLPQPLEASSSPGQQEPVPLPQKKPAAKTSVESTDWIATSLKRRFGLGMGLAWAGFLAVGVLSEQIKTRLEVSQQEANTRNVEKEEEVVLPNGMRYYELRVGGGASPRSGGLFVIDLKGKIHKNSEVLVNTFKGDKKPLALVMGSRHYSKGVCEGIEYLLRSMKTGGKKRVTVPPNLGFQERHGFMYKVQIPPASLKYIFEIDKSQLRPLEFFSFF